VREFRRRTHWWFWAVAFFTGALTIPPLFVLESSPRRILDLLQPTMWVLFALQHRRSCVRLSEREIGSREASGGESAVAVADLRELRWENSGAICFGTLSGGFYTLSLSGIGRETREEIRAWLRDHVEVYRSGTKRAGRAAA
jgi:hypothetical protein